MDPSDAVNTILTDFYLQLLFKLWPLFALGLFMLLIIAFQKYRYLQKIRKSGIHEIDRMSGWEFEKFLEGLFQRKGYSVEHVGRSSGDYGGDLVISRDGVRTLVQAKRYEGSVGIKAIQEVVGGKLKYNCQKTMLVTNSYLTRQAWELGRANYVTMWTRKKLIEEILNSSRESD